MVSEWYRSDETEGLAGRGGCGLGHSAARSSVRLEWSGTSLTSALPKATSNMLLIFAGETESGGILPVAAPKA